MKFESKADIVNIMVSVTNSSKGLVIDFSLDLKEDVLWLEDIFRLSMPNVLDKKKFIDVVNFNTSLCMNQVKLTSKNVMLKKMVDSFEKATHIKLECPYKKVLKMMA